MLWEVDIYPATGLPNADAARVSGEAAELGLASKLDVVAARGFLLEGQLAQADVVRLAEFLLSDRIVQRTVVGQVGEAGLSTPPSKAAGKLVHVMPKPGVMDPVAQSTREAIADFGLKVDNVRTIRKYWLGDLEPKKLSLLCSKVLANDAIEQVVVGPLKLDRLDSGSQYRFEHKIVPLLSLDDAGLELLSKKGQLYLTLVEMQTIQAHFRQVGRDPSDIELETVAQTWSEHCSHKTLAGRIRYRDERGTREFKNMLKETIFAATVEIRKRLGAGDWCESVFKDNAGIIHFDDEYNVVMKVETHNHPSALEPYGGANTGIGGVIRDPLGTGMGAKPIANTDIFCFAPPDTAFDTLPPGVLHPKRVMRGVVSGVRDYGNRMGIPTVNGALYFDPRYLANPLVYCGNVGLIPKRFSHKEPKPGDHIVALGGRTGRDGIHGATFSSGELTDESEMLSGGAVQIGNAITEKMLLDVLLAARDRGLYHAVTDCGAGGFSSAVGEMGEEIGAEVWLDKCPLKYEGLSYTEIWISEAQERMILAVGPDQWTEFSALAASEGVEATVIGVYAPTSRLILKYQGQVVGDVAMSFLHEGRPPVVREAVYEPVASTEMKLTAPAGGNYTPALLKILGSLNVASKEWVIRQYDHEVQGGSVVKPLVGVANDGPSDGAVVRPRLESRRGVVITNGMNPHYGDFDTWHMAASAIDEAVRNAVALGADPARIAILDNFCWGNTARPETLGSLVRAALACQELAVALGTPFISGKDSLNNEFSYVDSSGTKRTISIPPSLLISALGQIEDVSQAVTMDLKKSGNLLYQVGSTQLELGGSHYGLVEGLAGGSVPQVDAARAKKTFDALHQAMRAGTVRACHDLSEGGLALTLAEMAIAGGLGVKASLANIPNALSGVAEPAATVALLYSESNTRFVCEVAPDLAAEFERHLAGVPYARIGEVTTSGKVEIDRQPGGPRLIDAGIADLKAAWQKPLAW